MCLIKVINSTPLVSVFRLSLLQPIIVTLTLLTLPHSGTLLLLHWLTIYTLSDTHRAFIRFPHMLSYCSIKYAYGCTHSCVFGVTAFPKKHTETPQSREMQEKEAESQEITSSGD